MADIFEQRYNEDCEFCGANPCLSDCPEFLITNDIDDVKPIASLFENYKGFQPARAPLRKGAISITAKYRGRLKETSGIKATRIAPHLRSSVKGVFG